MSDQKYMLMAVNKTNGESIFTGKISTISHIKTWIAKANTRDNLKKKFIFTWIPVDDLDDEYLELFESLNTTAHR